MINHVSTCDMGEYFYKQKKKRKKEKKEWEAGKCHLIHKPMDGSIEINDNN